MEFQDINERIYRLRSIIDVGDCTRNDVPAKIFVKVAVSTNYLVQGLELNLSILRPIDSFDVFVYRTNMSMQIV